MHSGGWGFYEQQRGEGMDLVVVVVVVWELGRDGGCRAANITLLPQSVLGAPPPRVCSKAHGQLQPHTAGSQKFTSTVPRHGAVEQKALQRKRAKPQAFC